MNQSDWASPALSAEHPDHTLPPASIQRRRPWGLRKNRPQAGAGLGLSLMLAFFAASPPASDAADPSEARPNILMLFVDQLRWCEVGCYGNRVIRTPHIDQLAAQGARFTHAFANFPSCSPARSTLLSGRQARSNGVYANQHGNSGLRRPTNRDTTLAEALAAAGYATALVGKWHLTPNPQALGFQKSWQAFYGTGYLNTRWRVNEQPESDYTFEGYTLEHESDLAIQFLREHRDRPFFLYAAPSPPHMPLDDLPARYKSIYAPEAMPLRPNVWKDGQLAYDEHWFKIYLWDVRYYGHRETFKEPLPDGMDLRRLMTLYYGQITATDDWVGRILAELKVLGLEENTIVVFSSDHGDLFGSHQLYNKNQHYDEAARIPLIVRYPRRLQPRVIDRQIISLADLMPTLLELCSVKIPASVQGTSLAPVLTGRQETAGENVAFIETTVNEGVRTMRHLYYCNRKTHDKERLFDVEKDPYQMQDVVQDPAYQEVLVKLREQTRVWRERTPSVEPEKVPVSSRRL